MQAEVDRKPLLKRKSSWIIGGAVTIGAVAAIVTSIAVQQGGQAAPPSALGEVVPADADSVVVTPAGDDWWGKVAAMTAPETGLADLDAPPSELNIQHFGYSRSPDVQERELDALGPLRLVYAETPSSEDAEAAAEWFRAEQTGGVRVHVIAETVVLSPSWVSEYAAPTEPLSTVVDLSGPTAGDEAVMWMNVDQEVASLAAPEIADDYQTVLRNALGFKEGTTWLGSSSDGDSWAGAFRSGGVDPELLDFEAMEEMAQDKSKVLGEVAGQQVKYEVIDPGFGAILNVGKIEAPSQQRPLGGSPIQTEMPAVADEVVSARHDVSGWNTAVRGFGGSAENVQERHISASESEMVLSLSYAAMVEP